MSRETDDADCDCVRYGRGLREEDGRALVFSLSLLVPLSYRIPSVKKTAAPLPTMTATPPMMVVVLINN